ncbi:alpha/beta fold hydrolase [Planctomicrobium sp. SH661]|uniref:alpha/beta fold hydrolase n=1 Tax=Planctomicrobium sp. SH661 TaxID=3448124 RepID=UPI003F5B7980
MSHLHQPLMTDERLQRGYVIILPGIEGRSWLNRCIRRGLKDAGVPYAVEIHDWTCRWPLALYNLRSRRLHNLQAKIIQDKLLSYRQRWPHRPVFLIGHSGGGAMALHILHGMPEKSSISGAVLLGAAISPAYDYRPALKHVERKIWNFTSLADVLFLGLLTAVAGTLDGRNSLSAGMVGFQKRELTLSEADKFQEMPYRLEYCRDRHLAGHFGFTAPRFVRNHVAPLLMQVEERCDVPALAAGRLSDCLPNPAAP